MNIRNRMLMNNLLVGILPVILAVFIFILVFVSMWEKQVEDLLTSTITKIKTGINQTADKQQFFAVNLAGLITSQDDFYDAAENADGLTDMMEEYEMRTRIASAVNYAGNSAAIIEIFYKDQVIDYHSFDWRSYVESKTSDEQANEIWTYMKAPAIHEFFTMIFPMVVSNKVVIKNAAILYDDIRIEKAGMVVCSFPLDRDFLYDMDFVGNDVIAFVVGAESVIFSRSDFNDLDLYAQIEDFESTDESPYRKLSIHGFGSYYMTKDSMYTVPERISNRIVQVPIAEVGVLYNAEQINSQLSVFIRLSIIILLSIIVAVTIPAFLFARQLTDPILDLKNNVIAFKEKMKVISEPKAIKDEIDTLHQSFSTMSRDIIVYQEKLKDAMKQAEEENQLKSRFLANISHELRTPLTLMVAPLEMILNGEMGQVNPDVAGHLSNIHSNSLRLLKLINNLLDYSKLEAGRLETRIRKFDVIKQIKFFISTLESAAETRHIDLEWGADSEKLDLYLDPDMFEKIIMNLLSNAFKFTGNGGKIKIDIGRKRGKAIISVSDTGIGIPKDKLPLIFERFAQVDDARKKQYEGTGIGLSLVKELVELHGGTISVDSVPDEGTTFTIRFKEGKAHLDPSLIVDESGELESEVKNYHVSDFKGSLVENDEDAEDESVPDEGTKEIYEEEFSPGGKVLVVDDNLEMRKFISFLLKDEYQVFRARNGQEGLEKARKILPDLILSDVMMPVMNGYQLVRQVKSDPELKHVPVILISAKAESSQKLEGLEYGADDYLSKPFNSKELMVRAKNLLINRHLQDELVKKQREIESDFEQASLVQKSILTPQEDYDSLQELEIHAVYHPMNDKVSGDYFNISPMENGIASIMIADISGHGTQAALLTMQLDVLFKATTPISEPQQRVASINHHIATHYKNKNFITGFVVNIFPERITYCCAGHPDQYLLRHRTGEIVPLKTEGMIIGIVDIDRFISDTQTIENGDVLILLTDGLFEQFNLQNEEYGEERFIRKLEELVPRIDKLSMKELAGILFDDVNEFRAGQASNDDITLLTIRIK